MSFDQHLLSGAADILASETVDLVALAKLASCNPEDFYVGADLNGVDIRGQDLRHLNFRGADFSGTIYDERTRVSAAFVPLDWNLNTFKTAELTDLVYRYLKEMVASGEAKTLTQALRILTRTTVSEIFNYNDIYNWVLYLQEHKQYGPALRAPRKGRTNMSMKVYSEEHRFIIILGKIVRARSAGYNAAAMIAMEIRAGRHPQIQFPTVPPKRRMF